MVFMCKPMTDNAVVEVVAVIVLISRCVSY